MTDAIKRPLSAFLRRFRRLDAERISSGASLRLLFILRNVFGYRHLRALIRAFDALPGMDVHVVFEAPFALDAVVEPEDRAFLEPLVVSPFRARLGKWTYIFRTDFTTLTFLRPATCVAVPHGLAHGNVARPAAHANDSGSEAEYWMEHAGAEDVDILLFHAESVVRRLADVRPRVLEDPRTAPFVSGCPMLDRRINEPQDGAAARRALGLPSDQPTVLLTSHWTATGLLPTLGRAVVDALMELGPGVNLLIQGHEKLWTDPPGVSHTPAGLQEHLAALDGAHRHVRFVPATADMVSLLTAADLFVCDNSSVFVECCVADRPILFFDHPAVRFSSPDVERLYREASRPFASVEEGLATAREVLEGHDDQAPHRRRVADYFLENRGTAVRYITRLIRELGDVRGPDSPGWRRVRERCRVEGALPAPPATPSIGPPPPRCSCSRWSSGPS